jgi:hypothetical protein
VSRTRIERIAREEKPVTADTALRLGKFFKTGAAFWMNIQARYDLETAEDARAANQEDRCLQGGVRVTAHLIKRECLAHRRPHSDDCEANVPLGRQNRLDPSQGRSESAGKQIEQQQATFKEIAEAQAKAWGEAAGKFREAAGKVAADRSADLDAALKQMKADAADAEARPQKLRQAGSESWPVLSGALAQSRKAFDQANQAAWDAWKGSGSKG